jgi:hypothetical protein
MNTWIEWMMNSENLGARIMENRVLDRKLWALEAFKGKMVFLGDSGVILVFLEWMDGLGTKDRGFCEIWDFFRGFLCILGCLGVVQELIINSF